MLIKRFSTLGKSMLVLIASVAFISVCVSEIAAAGSNSTLCLVVNSSRPEEDVSK